MALLAQGQGSEDYQRTVLVCLIILILLGLWIVLAVHRLARNQVQMARLIEETLAAEAGPTATPKAAPPPEPESDG